MKILFATGNKGKAKEVKDLFAGSGIEIYSLSDIGEYADIEENGDTFEANAKIKADFIYEKYKTPVIADDSGLICEQLDGRPGVYSARYAGENCTYADNNRKIIEELKSFPEPHPASFVCCAVFYDGMQYMVNKGEFNGKIIDEERGTNGFGYDPVFVPHEMNNTLAELSLQEKNKMSHRAKAFMGLKEKILEHYKKSR